MSELAEALECLDNRPFQMSRFIMAAVDLRDLFEWSGTSVEGWLAEVSDNAIIECQDGGVFSG